MPFDQPVGERPAHIPQRCDQSVNLATMLDALTDAQVWGDDSLVVDLHAVKVYPHSPHPDADVLGGDTGAVIRIWRPTQHA